jgi:glycosyltransferase involved in cell wall biosynthesis
VQISIVMCTFNGTQYLPEQLDSIIRQTRLPDEFIVCDDVSTDNTLTILRNYEKSFRFPVRIRCNTKTLGVARNFEQAIGLAQGDIIVLCDQDDVWRHDKLQILEQILADNPDVGYVFSDAVLINEDGRSVHHSLWQQVSFDSKKRAIFSRGSIDQVRILVGRNVVTGASMALRSSLKPIVLPILEQWVHDEWIALAASLNGIRGFPIQEPLIYYRQHSAQVIGGPLRSPLALLKRGWWYFSGDPQAYGYYEHEIRKWNTLCALLKGTVNQASPAFPLLEEKVAHVVLRAKLCRWPRAIRLAAIAAELSRGGYHLYSTGWRSVIKDLLVPTLNDSRFAHF